MILLVPYYQGFVHDHRCKNKIKSAVPHQKNVVTKGVSILLYIATSIYR